MYVTDHAGTGISTQDATGTATLLFGNKAIRVTLHPMKDNGMKGTGRFNLALDMKVAVTIALAGQKAEMTHFTPLRKPKVKHQVKHERQPAR